MPSKRILIMDAGCLSALDLPATLAELDCSVVGRAAGGEDAVRLAGELRPDLVLVDVHLRSEMGAIQAASRIRALYDIPSVFLSVRNTNGPDADGTAGYLVKPFSGRELAALMTEALRGSDSERKLRESEARYHALFDLMAQGVIYQDAAGRIFSINPAAARILGVNQSLLEGRTTLDIFKPAIHEDGSPFPVEERSGLLALKTKQDVSNVIMGLYHPGKDEYIWIRIHSRPQFPPGSAEPDMVITTFEDITDIKKNADRLEASEAQLRKFSQVVEQSGDNIVITDTDGNIEYVNPQFEQTTGYSLSEVLGQNPRVLKSGEQSAELYHELWQTIKAGHIWRGELHNKRKDGSLYWEEVSIAPVADERGAVTNYVANKKEITGRKQLELEMRIKDSAINSSLNAIALADLNGCLTYVNPAFLELWGYDSPAEIVGRSATGLWQRGSPIGEIILAVLSGSGWKGEIQALRTDGTGVDVEVSAVLVRDQAGKPLCMMGSFVDVTARKQAEAAEREERLLAEALRNTAETLSSSLKLDDVLEQILDNMGRVVANDSMSIMLIEGERLRVVRQRGIGEYDGRDLFSQTFTLDDFPPLKIMQDTQQPCIIPDVHASELWARHPGAEWIRSYAGVPICTREKVIGFLNLDSSTANFFAPSQASRLKAFASQAAVALDNARLYEQDHILSITDGLTGLYNARYFYELARLEFESSRRYNSQLSVMMIDADFFKQVNDTYGHLVGDDVLREIARRVKESLRVVDIAARYGGEEFVILMARTDSFEAVNAAERIHKAVDSLPIELPDGRQISVSVSIGVASLAPDHQDLHQLVRCADDALYLAKSSGRNQISVWEGER